MDVTMLRYIVTIAEEKKLARAAEKLFVTSSALSQHIKKLENDLGTPLFEKINSHTFLLTNAGEIYVQAATKILSIKEGAYREIQDELLPGRGSFVFGCSPKRGLAMLANVYPAFHKAYPRIRMDLKEANLNVLYKSVLEGSVDIAVLTPTSDEDKLMNFEFLDQEEIVLAIPVDHPQAALARGSRQGTLTLKQLQLFQEDDWMMSNKGSMLRNLTDEIMQKAGFFPEKVLLEASSTNPHIAAIEAGIAVGFIPLPRTKKKADLVVFHLEPRQYRRLYAAYRNRYRLSESQIFLIEEIRKFFASAIYTDLPPHLLGW